MTTPNFIQPSDYNDFGEVVSRRESRSFLDQDSSCQLFHIWQLLAAIYSYDSCDSCVCTLPSASKQSRDAYKTQYTAQCIAGIFPQKNNGQELPGLSNKATKLVIPRFSGSGSVFRIQSSGLNRRSNNRHWKQR